MNGDWSKMIEIDGSHGEGGGQILRTSVALSALTMKPVRVSKVRAGRPKPGLKAQHIAGIELVGRIVDAEISGLRVGSTEVSFLPRRRLAGRFVYDIGTAGSISLVLQAVLPAAVLANSPLEFELRGGTDVSWSPPVDYMINVFLPALQSIGPEIRMIQKRRGHYPRGGGLVECQVRPARQLRSINQVDFGSLDRVEGISHCVRLPPHVAKRQADSATEIIRQHGIEKVRVDQDTYPANADPHAGPGSGIVIWSISLSGARLGADALGEKGKPAESVGEAAGRDLLAGLSTGRAVDPHLADMLVPYVGLAAGTSRIGITEISSHLLTNIWVAEQMLGCRMELQGKVGEPGVLQVQGIGMAPLSS